jgi:hypothetical protein
MAERERLRRDKIIAYKIDRSSKVSSSERSPERGNFPLRRQNNSVQTIPTMQTRSSLETLTLRPSQLAGLPAVKDSRTRAQTQAQTLVPSM